MRLAVTYNVKKTTHDVRLPPDYYAEWDSPETIEAVKEALKQRYSEVFLIEADKNACEKLQSLKPDIVFNMAEGLKGESRESHMPAILELLDIPYTGSNPLTLGLCLNKARAKEILGYRKIPTPGHFIAESADFLKMDIGFNFPLIVKPLYEGSSKGVKNDSIVRCEKEFKEKVSLILKDYNQPAIVEEFLDGREFTVSLIGNKGALRVLPIVEINYSSLPAGVNPIYSYEAKWVYDRPEAPLDIFVCPARIDESLNAAISNVAESAFFALGVRDWCRIDVRLDSKGTPNVLELNPLPGILPSPEENSCFPKAARAAGLSFNDLVNAVVDAARKRYGI